MKTTRLPIKFLLLIILVGGFLVVGSIVVRNRLFYSSKLASKEALALSDKINSIPPEDMSENEDTSEKRIELLKQIDSLTEESVSGNGFSSRIYALVKVRLDQALKEIPNAQVPKGKVKLWYIYNMGVIAKSEDKTIAFDLAGTYAYPNLADFSKYIDIMVISHFDNDHFNLPVVKEALKNGVTVIIPGDKISITGNQFTGNLVNSDPKGEDAVNLIKRRNEINSDNFISLKPQEKTIIKGVEITAYPAIHMYNADTETDISTLTPVSWYYVNLSGLNIIHMGDGASFDSQPDFINKNVDLFIIHSTNIDPRTNDTLMKLVPNAKTILPLHILELGHGSGIVKEKHDSYMNYRCLLDNYSNGYYRTLSGKNRFVPMIWGESLLF